ncbi:uncharacterized protein A1O5_12717 [Cladophialophora psammophila CBS 110553]|uniref:Uncharacterized protein n=1 Tax=Cladophialophora psammophila CBS 110553 TaxID=1182543 RepID=W9VVL8_9EURO|nr:uncharacterized protein A1O5_12717 [Cladophialophora psammophila CBS 110553]EXJ56261.1 hypothetical protein A1O5_12717 [Cladophialophora psammophila CBS 110553]
MAFSYQNIPCPRLPFNLEYALTLGQSLNIAALIIVNVFMRAADYRAAAPHAWYGSDKYYAVMAYIMWCIGAFAVIYLTLEA